ncbi:GntR family transcriptional regulator [Lentibacter sp. XHP0401]|jgi:DNA-binding GntR family transcriptional regulator|uniref:GntR family transcriptional regulator n=1 Tax=Lentibacter sp. XHP0401 TaxID=2984334 RepID=UPI0021E86AF0|nr:GntR family transcriptional regulator [Lentibacter sp. XHP0401]MCV2894420.1 GntR family transcriptional regulator [Lentibacter sp. XHP0401]
MPKEKPDLQTERALSALLQQLRSGELAGGTFLSMPMLVESLDMPISSVREAVKRAEATGLLTILPKRGIMVMDAGPETTRDCLELRAMFDCEGARCLIERGSEMPLGALRQSHESLLKEAEQEAFPDLSPRAISTDLLLHDTLAAGIGSQLAARLYAENRDRIAIIQNSRPFLPARIVSAMREHLDIIAALEARDVSAAHDAIRTHLRNTLGWWGVQS